MTSPNIVEIHFPNSNMTGKNLHLDASVKTGLEVLNMENCEALTGKGLVNILRYTSDTLKKLNINGTSLTLLEIGSLPSIKSLEDLSVAGCLKVTDKSFISFLNKSGGNLKRLNLAGTMIRLIDVGSLTTLSPYLEQLVLASCYSIRDAGLVYFLNKVGRNLKSLDLSRTEITLSEVGSPTNRFASLEALPSLETLVLETCHNITDMGLISFLNRTGGNLESINLSDTMITLSEVGLLTTCLFSLQELNLSWCPSLTDIGLISFLNRTGGSMKRLDLSATRITLSEVGSLATWCPNLEELDLSYCRKITEDGLISLLEKTGKHLTLKLLKTVISFEIIKAKFPRIKLM